MVNQSAGVLAWHPAAAPDPQAHLLDSVATITSNRDLGALDYSLVLSLAQLATAHSAALARRDDAGEVTIVHCASAETDHGGGPATVDDPKAAAWETLRRCLDQGQALVGQAGGHTRVCVPIRHEGRTLGALQLDGSGGADALRPLAEAFARIYANYTTLLLESERDKLTGLCNRRSLERQLQRMLLQQEHVANGAESDAEAPGVWLAITDIDHFKHVNDTYGHVLGDEVILLLAQRMKANFRHDDLLFRFGGEEFVVLLGNVGATNVHAAIERFRHSVELREYPQVGRVTVSIGYARASRHDYPESLIERADKALYYAKEHGRNQTRCYDTLRGQGLLGDDVAAGSIDLF